MDLLDMLTALNESVQRGVNFDKQSDRNMSRGKK